MTEDYPAVNIGRKRQQTARSIWNGLFAARDIKAISARWPEDPDGSRDVITRQI